MRFGICLTVSACCCLGCTSLSLQRNALSQAATSQDIRYQEVMDNLAMVAKEPSSLPVYSSIFAGTTQVTDSGSLASTTNWQHQIGPGAQNGFASEATNPQASRMLSDNWALDPIADPEKLQVLRAACHWVLFGPDSVAPEDMRLLNDPDQDPSPGRHFGVSADLARLKPGWVHCGKLRDVPLCAAYKGHYGQTYVWVLPDDTDALAEFTLVFQNIARVSINSFTLFYIPPAPGTFSILTDNALLPDGHWASVAANVSVYPGLRIVPDGPYYRWREDNRGAAPPTITSKISAAALTP